VPYFAGERREMFAILAGSAGLALLSSWLFVAARDGFAKALMVTVLVAAFLLSATAISLLARDAKLRTVLASMVDSDGGGAGLSAERARVGEVISKYRYYRYSAVLIGVAALTALAVSRRGWVHGVAAGLLLLVVAQVVIDHYSERRARRYSDRLSGAASVSVVEQSR
jgi:hypothetical protein